MTLLDARAKRPVRILEIDDDQARAQCIRLGVGEGTVVSAETLRLGPVLVRHEASEVCIGRELAERIVVEEAHSRPDDGAPFTGGFEPGRAA